MIELIEMDMDFEPIEFDPELPVDLVKITDEGIQRARIKPNCFPDQRSDYPMVSMPITFLPNDYLLVAPKSLPGNHDLKSNRRLKLGKIVLPIPEGFLPLFIDDACQQHYPIEQSGRLLCSMPNDNHLNVLVDKIIDLNCDRVSKSKLTFSLRNRKMKAKDIEHVLDYLVNCGALQELENIDTPMPVAGRKPSQEYMVLWGKSQFFPQKSQEETVEE